MTKAFLVKGLANQILKYDLTNSDKNARLGNKEFCIVSLSIEFVETVNHIVSITSNINVTTTINEKTGKLELKNTPLNILEISGEKGHKKVYHFSDSTWFELNLRGEQIQFELKEIFNENTILEDHVVYLHVLYRST